MTKWSSQPIDKHVRRLWISSVFAETNAITMDKCVSRVLKLKEFKKTLLLAHKKAFYDMQQASSCAIDFPQPLGNEGVNSQHQRLGCNVAASENVTSPKPMEAVPDSQAGCDSPQVKRMVSELSISNRDVAAQDMTSSLDFPIEDQLLWTCSTCVDAKFTSKFRQHAPAAGRMFLQQCTWTVINWLDFCLVLNMQLFRNCCSMSSKKWGTAGGCLYTIEPCMVDLKVDLHYPWHYIGVKWWNCRVVRIVQQIYNMDFDFYEWCCRNVHFMYSGNYYLQCRLVLYFSTCNTWSGTVSHMLHSRSKRYAL